MVGFFIVRMLGFVEGSIFAVFVLVMVWGWFRMDFKDDKPFYRKNLVDGEVEEKSRVITLRINLDEEALIKRAKVLLDVEADTKALKILAKVGLNVILNLFGEETIRYLSSTKRERKSDYETPPKSKKDDFVIQKEPVL